MSGLTASLDISKLLLKLKNYSAVTKQSTRELINEQARLFVSDRKTGVMSLTPPNHDNVRGTAAKKAGEQAVARDIAKVYGSASRAYEFIRENAGAEVAGAFYAAFQQGEYAKAQAILSRYGGRWRNVKIGRFNKSYHAQYRRKGVVNRRIPAQIVTDEKSVKRYTKLKQKNVGMLASGWLAPAIRFKARGVPAWVKRHAQSLSSVEVKATNSAYEVRMESKVGYDARNTDVRARYALRYRNNAIKRRLPYLIKAAAKKANL